MEETQQVREFLATLEPLQALKDALDQEILELEAERETLRVTFLHEHEEAQITRERLHQEMANIQATLELARADMTRDIEEGTAAMEMEVARMQAAWQQMKDEHTRAMTQARATYEAKRQALQEELQTLEADVEAARATRQQGASMSDQLHQRLLTHTYHKPSAAVQESMHALRLAYMTLVEDLDSLIPECRAKSLALTALEESAMWGMKGLALTDPEGEVVQP